MTAPAVTGQAALPAETVVRLLRRAARMPSLRQKYAPWLARCPEAVSLTELPTLTQAELSQALGELDHEHASRSGSYLCASGGPIGAPTLSLMPADLFGADIATAWQPVTRGDVLANLFSPGQLWPAHQLASSIATAAGATVLPVTGLLTGPNLAAWLDYLQARGATALAAPPATLAQVLRHCASTGRRPACLAKLVWIGDELDVLAAGQALAGLPDAQVWGLYAPAQTGAVGWNGPACDPGTVHPLAYQHVEVVDGAVLVTSTHQRCLSPVLRYQLGAAGRFADCPCGASLPALRITSRTDSSFKFCGQLVSAAEIARLAREVADVAEARVVLRAPGNEAEELEIQVLRGPVPRPWLTDRVRRHVLTGHIALSQLPCDRPEALRITITTGRTLWAL